jgi:membrane protein DedA with SNARE-associated domain
MSKILDFILSSIHTHPFLSMFGGGLIEQIIVPIPSPIITMAGGALLTIKNLPFLNSLLSIFTNVSVPYTIGATIGVSLVYLTAYFGGKPLIDRFGKHIGLSWKLIENVKADWQKTIRDEVFIVVATIIPVVPVSLMAAFCGGFIIPPKKFYPLVFLALLVRATLLGFIGYQMGETYLSLAHGLDKIESLLTIGGAALILGLLYFKREKWIKKNS